MEVVELVECFAGIAGLRSAVDITSYYAATIDVLTTELSDARKNLDGLEMQLQLLPDSIEDGLNAAIQHLVDRATLSEVEARNDKKLNEVLESITKITRPALTAHAGPANWKPSTEEEINTALQPENRLRSLYAHKFDLFGSEPVNKLWPFDMQLDKEFQASLQGQAPGTLAVQAVRELATAATTPTATMPGMLAIR